VLRLAVIACDACIVACRCARMQLGAAMLASADCHQFPTSRERGARSRCEHTHRTHIAHTGAGERTVTLLQ
jgi:hypothetical protein